MASKRANQAAATATSEKTAVAKGRKRAGAAKVEGNAVGTPALEAGARGRKRTEPFVL